MTVLGLIIFTSIDTLATNTPNRRTITIPFVSICDNQLAKAMTIYASFLQ